MIKSTILFSLTFLFSQLLGQNLIINPGAEEQPYKSGWTNVQGSWTSENATTLGIIPHGGMYHFAVPAACYLEASTGNNSEIYQDIDVASDASSIDSGTALFVFSGWVATYQSQDNSRIVIEYRDASTQIIFTYDSGYLKKNSWYKVTNSKIAPINTRTIRIRLISKCGGTTGDDDGYYDDLSLTYEKTNVVTALNDVLLGDFSEILGVRIFDINGKIISSNKNLNNLSMSELPKAILIIAVETKEGIVIRKVINY